MLREKSPASSCPVPFPIHGKMQILPTSMGGQPRTKNEWTDNTAAKPIRLPLNLYGRAAIYLHVRSLEAEEA